MRRQGRRPLLGTQYLRFRTRTLGVGPRRGWRPLPACPGTSASASACCIVPTAIPFTRAHPRSLPVSASMGSPHRRIPTFADAVGSAALRNGTAAVTNTEHNGASAPQNNRFSASHHFPVTTLVNHITSVTAILANFPQLHFSQNLPTLFLIRAAWQHSGASALMVGRHRRTSTRMRNSVLTDLPRYAPHRRKHGGQQLLPESIGQLRHLDRAALRRTARRVQPQTGAQRGKRACALTARGSISKAMKGLVCGAAQGSSDCRRNWTTALIPRSSGIGTHPTSAECAEATRIAWGGGWYNMARSAMRSKARAGQVSHRCRMPNCRP